MISSEHVANNFLMHGQAEGIPITPLKLQKLVYFLYRKYLKVTGETLFHEQFETWKMGPVVPSIYSEFSSFGGNPITSFAQDSQGNCYKVEETGVFKDCFDNVWISCKNMTGYDLSKITHREGTAWSKAKEKRERYLNLEDIKNEVEQY